MEKILLFVRKYKTPIALISITLIIVIFILTVPKQSKPTVVSTSTPSPTIIAVPKGDWGSLDTIVSKLGTPLNQTDTATKSGEYRYKSSTTNRDHEVFYESNVPLFYKEVITKEDKKTSKSITQKYGMAEIKLYGPESDIGFDLYAYPSKGVAYVGSIYDDIITEVWYFSPTDLNNFMNTWAKEYSLQPLDGIF